jgi:hypothetical protein
MKEGLFADMFLLEYWSVEKQRTKNLWNVLQARNLLFFRTFCGTILRASSSNTPMLHHSNTPCKEHEMARAIGL